MLLSVQFCRRVQFSVSISAHLFSLRPLPPQRGGGGTLLHGGACCKHQEQERLAGEVSEGEARKSRGGRMGGACAARTRSERVSCSLAAQQCCCAGERNNATAPPLRCRPARATWARVPFDTQWRPTRGPLRLEKDPLRSTALAARRGRRGEPLGPTRRRPLP